MATKEQNQKWQKAYRERHPGRKAANGRKWRKTNIEKARASANAWLREHPEYAKKRRKRYAAKNREKILAQSAVVNAVKKGKLVRPSSCSRCGVSCKPDAHHHNGYSKEHRFDVVWLCRKCHSLAH